MNIKIKISIIIICISFLYADCFPQMTDSLKKGSFYSFTLNNGSVIKGKVLSFDSYVILLNTKNGMNEIFRKNIFNSKKAGDDFIVEYFTNFRKPEYRKYFCFSAGYVMPGKSDKSDESNYDLAEVHDGFNLSFSYTGFFGRNTAVRTGLSFSSMKNKDASRYNYNYYSTRTGGTLTQITFGMDVLLGMFYPEQKINYYALAGIGLGSMNSSSISWNDYYSYNTDPEFQFNIKFGIGAGLTYKLSGKISLQTEIDYDFNSTDEGFYDSMNQLILKAGIIFLNL